MLGFEVAQSTVSKYMVQGGSPSQSWKTFLRNQAQAIAAIDLCVIRTLTFERLVAFLVLGHGRRQLLWFEVTRHPTAEWLARQITEAWASAPAYLVRDNDLSYGHVFTSRVRAMGIRDRPISPGSTGCTTITSGYDFRKGHDPIACSRPRTPTAPATGAQSTLLTRSTPKKEAASVFVARSAE